MGLADWADDLLGAVGRLGSGTGLFETTVRLGVTGLSRSGKTVFVTALADSLLKRDRLKAFGPVAQGRIVGAVLGEQPDRGLTRFPYEANARAIREGRWPQATHTISQMRISIRYRPQGWSAWLSGTATLHLDIVDYPGEWLLDLPLLRMDFPTWSARVMRACGDEPRLSLSRSWRQWLDRIDPDAPADHETAEEGAALFTAFLQAARSDKANLSELPPGRFLLPGDMAGSLALTFCPLPAPAGATKRGSLRAFMERNYAAYLETVVKPFYANHFASIDRQIVLVDLMSVLNAGPVAWDDLETTLTDVMASFKAGRAGWLGRLLGAHRVSRVLFAATKADQLHHEAHDRLESLMRSLVKRASDRVSYEGATVRAMAVAGLRATTEETVEHEGESLPCIVGIPPGEAAPLPVFPGALPDSADDVFPGGAAGDFHFVSFDPPKGLSREAGMPHVRLDRALDFLIGEDLA